MVTPALKNEFTRQGIKLIPLSAGAKCMVNELCRASQAPIEIVIGATITKTQAQPTQNVARVLPSKEKMTLVFEREINISHYPVLKSHIIGGRPVVPLALILEWLGHGALHRNPGLQLHGYKEVRVLKGIRLEQKSQNIRLLVGKTKKRGKSFEVNVEICGEGSQKHVAARAILRNTFPQQPVFKNLAQLPINEYQREIEAAYQDILFHGPALRAIHNIYGYSDKAMLAELAPSPAPGTWMKEAPRSKWISDPLIIDGAFQMAILWCFEHTGKVSLPSYVGQYLQYAPFPNQNVKVALEIQEVTENKMRGNFTFLDASEKIIATLNDYECTMDSSLYQVFQKKAV